MLPEWEKLAEWGAILITGFGVVFASGKNRQAQVENRKCIDELKKAVFPEDPGREIIRQSDLDRQCAQIEKLFAVMERNLIQSIEIILNKEKNDNS